MSKRSVSNCLFFVGHHFCLLGVVRAMTETQICEWMSADQQKLAKNAFLRGQKAAEKMEKYGSTEDMRKKGSPMKLQKVKHTLTQHTF